MCVCSDDGRWATQSGRLPPHSSSLRTVPPCFFFKFCFYFSCFWKAKKKRSQLERVLSRTQLMHDHGFFFCCCLCFVFCFCPPRSCLRFDLCVQSSSCCNSILYASRCCSHLFFFLMYVYRLVLSHLTCLVHISIYIHTYIYVCCADEVGKQASNAPHNKKEKRRGENFKKAPCSRDSKPRACVVCVCVHGSEYIQQH